MTALAAEIRSEPVFRAAELKRVGTAATMIAVCGTIIIIAVMMMIGHYNPLVHCGPKAVLDGAVIALLIGRRGRWRCLTLLGTVYGFVLLIQIGLFYLLPVMILAGATGALIGRMVSPIHRTLAIVLAACAYELFSSFGSPIKIYFGTGGNNEPFIWALWFAEWPLRIAGAIVGVAIAKRWAAKRVIFGATSGETIPTPNRISHDRINGTPPIANRKSRCPFPTTVASRVVMCMLACSVPMVLQPWIALSIIAAIYFLYALAAGMRKSLMHAILGLLWGWIFFGLLSYGWHRDMHRVIDLGRTWALRFAPIFFSSIVLVARVKPRDLMRLLRRIHVPGAVIIPLSSVIRSVPQSRRMMSAKVNELRACGRWSAPLSVLRHPRTILRELLLPQFSRWAHELVKDMN